MIDRYTKAVLTVIAAALVALVAQGAIRQSRAANEHDVQKVMICDDQNSDCVRLSYSTKAGKVLQVLPVPGN